MFAKLKSTKSQSQKHLPMADVLLKAHGLSPSGHFCHYTSVSYHGLTNQVPAQFYIRKGNIGARKQTRPDRLTDLQISAQFVKPHRKTSKMISYGGSRIVQVSGYRHDNTGVVPVSPHQKLFPANSRVTNLERCLIDAVVAPHYNGGLTSLPDFFENAAEHLDLDTLIRQYKEMNFLYPYHQTIGFLLDCAGLNEQADALRAVLPPTNRFFVDHEAKATWPYDTKWQVRYPSWLK